MGRMPDSRKDISLWVSPIIVKRKGTRDHVVVDWTPPEGISHWLYKVIAVKMLLLDGFTRGEIFVEHTVRVRGGSIRADVFGQRPLSRGHFKTVWFECGEVATEKMRRIQNSIKGCKLIRIKTYDQVSDLWFSNDKDYNIGTTLIPGSEIWGAYFGDTPRIVYGIRRTKKGYVFLDGDWAVRSHLELRKHDVVERLTL